MINTLEDRTIAAKSGVEKGTADIDAALAKVGATRNIERITAEVKARSGEFQIMHEQAQKLSTPQINLSVVGSPYEAIITNEAGERIMPKSMLEGLAKRIENAFNEEARLYDSRHAQGTGLLQFTLREGDLKCNYIEEDEPMDLSTALALLVQVLNKERTNKITVVFQDGEKTLFTKGEITE